MAKRFGRNQKRKMQDRIDHLQPQVEGLQALNETEKLQKLEARYKLETARAQMTEVAERLCRAIGKNNAILPIDLMDHQMDTARGDIYRVPIGGFEVPVVSYEALHEARMDEKIWVADVMQLVLKVERNPHQYETLIRFGTKDNNGTHASYCISDRALKEIGIMGKDIEYISHMVARELAIHINQSQQAYTGLSRW